LRREKEEIVSDRPRNEKEEKEEKGRGDGWDEKWRSDPVDAAVWATILIWAGLVLLAGTLGIGWEVWPIVFLGGGVIVILGAVFRLLVPVYRRPVIGNLIIGVILLGIGLGGLTGRYEVIGALVLIVIGVGALLRGFIPRS